MVVAEMVGGRGGPGLGVVKVLVSPPQKARGDVLDAQSRTRSPCGTQFRFAADPCPIKALLPKRHQRTTAAHRRPRLLGRMALTEIPLKRANQSKTLMRSFPFGQLKAGCNLPQVPPVLPGPGHARTSCRQNQKAQPDSQERRGGSIIFRNPPYPSFQISCFCTHFHCLMSAMQSDHRLPPLFAEFHDHARATLGDNQREAACRRDNDDTPPALVGLSVGRLEVGWPERSPFSLREDTLRLVMTCTASAGQMTSDSSGSPSEGCAQPDRQEEMGV